MPMSTQSLSRCSNGSSMPSPTETPPASRRAAVDRLHRARAAAGDHGVAGRGQRRAERHARWRTRGRPPAVRAEPNTDDRRPAVRPAGRSPRRTRSGCAAPATGRCAPSRTGRASRAAAGRWCRARTCARRSSTGPRWCSDRRSRCVGHVTDGQRARPLAARDNGSGQEPDQRRLGRVRSAPPPRAPRGLWARLGSPGPKLSAGMPSSPNRATSVQPNLARGAPPTARDERRRERRVQARPGGRRGVDDVELEAGEAPPARAPSASASTAVGREAEVDGHDALVGDDVAGHPAADRAPR